MIRIILAITVLVALIACNEAPMQEKAITNNEPIDNSADVIVASTLSDKNGNILKIAYNNTQGTATIDFNGESEKLLEQKAASGIWYSNEHFELRGKGNDLKLMKDGNVLLTHKDDIVRTMLRNEDGQTLDMTFNNTTGHVKVYLDGGEEIAMEAEKAASGIWYKNDQCELRGKGEDLELKKDGVIIFKNE